MVARKPFLNGRTGSLALLTNIPFPPRLPALNQVARSMDGRFEVRFIAASEPRRWWKVPTQEMNFKWRFLSHSSDPAGFLTGIRASAAMLAFLTRSRPQALICGGYDSLPAWASFAWCKLFRRRFVLWIVSNARDHRQPGKLKEWLKRFFVSNVDAVAAQGKASAEYARQLGAREEQVFIAPYGGDNEFFAREAARVNPAQEKELHGYPPRLILFSARLAPEKGVFVLLEAFRSVSSKLPGVGLLIVGDGPERKAMEDFCRAANLERVYFLGPQQYHRMPYFYALADVLVLPSLSEPWGAVVNEAFACGVPAIVSRVAGAADDLIIEGETGFTVEPGNTQDLSEKTLRVLRDEALRARMSANCRRLIEKYSAAGCAEGLLAAAAVGSK